MEIRKRLIVAVNTMASCRCRGVSVALIASAVIKPRLPIYIDPSFPTIVLLLEIEKHTKVRFVADADRYKSKDAYCKSQCVTFRSNSLLNPLAEDEMKKKISFSVLDSPQ